MIWIFWSISNLTFAGYTVSKSQVRNRLKIQFVEPDFSKSIFQKIKYRLIVGQLLVSMYFNQLQNSSAVVEGRNFCRSSFLTDCPTKARSARKQVKNLLKFIF